MTKYMLYHLSNTKHDVLKSKTQVSPNTTGLKDFDNLISLLLTPITSEDIKQYVRAGFERWNMDEAYLFVIDPDAITNYDYACMQSTPQQTAYDDVNWDYDPSVMRQYQFQSWKEEYMRKRTEYLNDIHGIAPRGTIPSVMSNKHYGQWQEHVWVTYNLKHGNHDQYATYIPHMQVHINEPIVYQDVIKLK